MLNTPMKQAQILKLSKQANELTPINVVRSLHPDTLGMIAGGTAATLPFLPWNTAGALRDKMKGQYREDELPQSLISDTSRGIGAALGAGAVKGLSETWHLPKTSPLFNLAMILGGTGVGAFMGQRQGRTIGQDLFPGSLSDRLHRAVNRF